MLNDILPGIEIITPVWGKAKENICSKTRRYHHALQDSPQRHHQNEYRSHRQYGLCPPGSRRGCDSAVYKAAGYEELLEYRKEKIGFVPEGEEEKLRACYRNSLRIAKEYHIRSIVFPLISMGSFGYPKEEGMRIAADEINAFLLRNEMLVCLVVFDSKAAALGAKICPDLEAYIDHNYVRGKQQEEYGNPYFGPAMQGDAGYRPHLSNEEMIRQRAGSRIVTKTLPARPHK